MLLSNAHSNSTILRDEDADNMNKGVHMPTFEVSAHGKLRVKTEFGEF